MREHPGHPQAVRLDGVFAERFGVRRRQLSMPIYVCVFRHSHDSSGAKISVT
jgi:hypothetical protein